MTEEQKKFNKKYKELGAKHSWSSDDFAVLLDDSRTGSSAYLQDFHFHYFFTVLRHQFGEELQPPQDIDTSTHRGLLPVDPTKPFVQVLHVGDHWVVVTNIGQKSSDNSLLLYDSLASTLKGSGGRRPLIREGIKWQTAQLLRRQGGENKRVLSIKVRPCQQQENASSCGVYALANVISLLNGLDPSEIKYTGDMRKELYNMMAAQQLVPFRHEKNEGSFTIPGSSLVPKTRFLEMDHSFTVLCFCGQPESVGDVVECDSCGQTYHQVCFANKLKKSSL